ncbi:hypothetical protein K7432_011559 [Basidiobolus ranarum]|uniref:HSF-type DNA-binding domain-containing protein n=1 Tax=Basidiobolus ranarum TaxID=34480 RepID=A0ABR2WM25_9FUNG
MNSRNSEYILVAPCQILSLVYGLHIYKAWHYRGKLESFMMLRGRTGKLSIRIPLFVLKLYQILSEQKYTDIIAWEESGTRFIIKDQLTFASKVLPQYYETSKFASFSRQLNIYGFYRVSDQRRTKQCSDTSMIIYSHQHFMRGQPNSLHLIQRMPGPYTQPKSRSPTSEPTTVLKPITSPPSIVTTNLLYLPTIELNARRRIQVFRRVNKRLLRLSSSGTGDYKFEESDYTLYIDLKGIFRIG